MRLDWSSTNRLTNRTRLYPLTVITVINSEAWRTDSVWNWPSASPLSSSWSLRWKLQSDPQHLRSSTTPKVEQLWEQQLCLDRLTSCISKSTHHDTTTTGLASECWLLSRTMTASLFLSFRLSLPPSSQNHAEQKNQLNTATNALIYNSRNQPYPLISRMHFSFWNRIAKSVICDQCSSYVLMKHIAVLVGPRHFQTTSSCNIIPFFIWTECSRHTFLWSVPKHVLLYKACARAIQDHHATYYEPKDTRPLTCPDQRWDLSPFHKYFLDSQATLIG